MEPFVPAKTRARLGGAFFLLDPRREQISSSGTFTSLAGGRITRGSAFGGNIWSRGRHEPPLAHVHVRRENRAREGSGGEPVAMRRPAQVPLDE